MRLGRIHIHDVRALRRLDEDLMILVDQHLMHVNTRRGLHDDISIRTDLLDDALDADRIKALRVHLLARLLLPEDEDGHLIALVDVVAGHRTEGLGLEKYIGVR